jgi:hypothetical protein
MEQIETAKPFTGVIEALQQTEISLNGKSKLNLFLEYTKGAETGLEVDVKFSQNQNGSDAFPRCAADASNVITSATNWEMTASGKYEIPEYTVEKGEKKAIVSFYGKNAALAAKTLSNLTYTSKLLAYLGNAVSVEYINPDTEAAALSVAVENETEIKVTLETNNGDLAVLVNQGLTYTAKAAYLLGVAGNGITIELVDPEEDGTISVLADQAAKTIQVTLAYGTGAITSDADAVKAAIEADVTANAMVTITGSGSSVLTALVATALAGGGAGIDILSTEAEVEAAINDLPAAFALVTITGTASGTVSAAAETFLTGGLPTGTVNLFSN